MHAAVQRKSIQDESLNFILAKTDSRGLVGKQIVPNNFSTCSSLKSQKVQNVNVLCYLWTDRMSEKIHLGTVTKGCALM